MEFMNIKDYVTSEKKKLKEEVATLKIHREFVIVQVNDDPASNSYIKGKLKDCAEVGIKARLLKFDPAISETLLIRKIKQLNKNPDVGGLIVQMPLPVHINETTIKQTVTPDKDVDGFHPLSKCSPCTPQGIVTYLKANNYVFSGKNALIIGRSNIVGKPMAKLLLKENMSTILTHSRTTKESMDAFIQLADLIVVAIGKAHFLNYPHYKKDAVIIDVGINHGTDGLEGDVAPNQSVLFQSPVPGGVGLLTRLTLMKNFISLQD
ncbi:MAG: bifunctional 5,10-methylenetetrahydrofolate dehydrogenase/5,10-methenyltetrahydrofolate cyclohydrolase [Erysipelotrichaceae bacterium]|jgi:methylenetetrahydrofolate dehydrogenase (NADP+)/methenyltetrahydrofolate cyclohydrolase|nr:bifunctional 5,10-methylenetetrahydrofolate dehydrogenase/5,10-methenyltetrahydrofolate cyclohydrolase [Erysipelotrichaceae bacterium]